MFTLILSFVAGVLTITAPCVFTLLPIIVGGSLVPGQKKNRLSRPLTIAASLAVSIIIFTLLLKFSTGLLGVPDLFWKVLSGGIIILLGLQFIVPSIWLRISSYLKLEQKSNKSLGKVVFKPGKKGDILTGLALGPVFSSCSPTYAFIVASVIPASFVEGVVYLTAYAAGLSTTLLLIAFIGQASAEKLGWASNPDGKFRKIIGLLFVIVGISIVVGLDKKFETFVLDSGALDGLIDFETRLRQ